MLFWFEMFRGINQTETEANIKWESYFEGINSPLLGRWIEYWANTILVTLFMEYLGGCSLLFCSVLWSSLDLSYSVLSVPSNVRPSYYRATGVYILSDHCQVSGQALHLQFCLVSCGLCRGEGRSANMQAVAANYNQLDPPPPPPPRHGVNLEFHWAAE